MIVQKIFNCTAVRSVEERILDLYHETERNHWHNAAKNKKAIKRLLEFRKWILNTTFVMDEQYKQLLAEFNDAMKQQLIEMRKRAIDLYNKVYKPDMTDDIEVEGKCFMGYEYSKIHPVQSMRAKKMWAVLNGSLDDFMPLYSNYGIQPFIVVKESKIVSENELLYLNEELDNWNDGLDREMTSNMHIIYAFHNLFSHMVFSIYDLLWVRDFNVEIHVEYDYNTYKNGEYGDDLDWKKCDYYD